MGTPLMLQEADVARIESLKKRLHARSKIEVVRSALDLLERDAERTDRIAKWNSVRRAGGGAICGAVVAPPCRRIGSKESSC